MRRPSPIPFLLALSFAWWCPGPARGQFQQIPRSGVETSGALSALVIFAKFQGEAPGDDRAPSWAADLFNASLPGSFTHFYTEMSRGKLHVEGQVLPRRYASRQPAAEYVAAASGTTGRFGPFNREILEQADRDADLGRFDNDGPDGLPNSGDDDGYVDVLFINLLTVPRDFFIGGATGLASLGLDTDFISNDAAASGGKIRVRGRFSGFGGTTQRGHTFSVTASTMCHEFGHVLGLPDLFDQSSVTAGGELDPVEDSAGVGKWCLMTSAGTQGWGVEDGPNAFSAWSLAELGWVEVEEISQSRQNLVIEDIALGHKVYKISLTEDEYFLIENRQRASSFYNRNIPESGLLIWHVDGRADNDEERHKQVDLVCADGLFADRGFPGDQPDPVNGGDNLDFWTKDEAYARAHNGNQGDATDPFDGARFTRFAHDTNPRFSAHTGFSRNLPLGVAVENIRRDGGRMRCDVLLRQPLSGHIAADTSWSGTVRLSGDVVVEPGATLSLAPGTRVQFGQGDDRRSGFDANRGELLVFGGLVLQGKARFEAPGEGGWSGIYLLGGQALDPENLEILHSLHGLARARLPAGTTRWSGPQHVPWDLVIPPGAELVVAPDAAIRFTPSDLSGSGASPQLVELVVEGRLNIEGGTFAVNQSRDQDLWYGVRLAPGAQVEARSATFERCGFGFSGEVSPEGAFHLADSRIQQGLGGLALNIGGQALVERTTFFHLSAAGIRGQGRGLLSLRDVVVEECGQEGLFIGNCSLEAVNTRLVRNGLLDAQDPRSGLKAVGGSGLQLTLWNCLLARNTRHGLELEGWEGVAELHDSQISANQEGGLRATGLERLTFEQVQVERNLGDGAVVAQVPLVEVWTTTFADNIGTGLVLGAGSSGAIEMSHFADNDGLRLEGVGRFFVRTSIFENAGVAFEAKDSAPLVEENLFQRNLTALKVSGSAVPTLTRNAFLDNRTAVENLSPLPLPARNNYWGTADSAAIAALFKGAVDWQPFLEADPDQTGVEEETGLPARFALHPGFPNPFNARTAIRFALPQAAPVELLICDALGRPVRRLVGETLEAGEHQVWWDGRDAAGELVASGVYFYRLKAGRFTGAGRLALVR